MTFYKYHATENDFVLLHGPEVPSLDVIRELAHRRRGVGCDQVILYQLREGAVHLRFFNADGSEAEMCGNGVRAALLHAERMGDLSKIGRDGAVSVVVGRRELRGVFRGQDHISVEMGRVELQRGSKGETSFELQWEGRRVRLTEASVGNPHVVVREVEGISDILSVADRLGPWLEHHAEFPNRTNVEFLNTSDLSLRVWERGVGFTQSCGSGACAAAAVLFSESENLEQVVLRLPGGALEVTCEERSKASVQVTLTGPARFVFAGTYDRSNQ